MTNVMMVGLTLRRLRHNTQADIRLCNLMLIHSWLVHFTGGGGCAPPCRDFRCWGVPRHASWPSTMIPTLEHSTSTCQPQRHHVSVRCNVPVYSGSLQSIMQPCSYLAMREPCVSCPAQCLSSDQNKSTTCLLR